MLKKTIFSVVATGFVLASTAEIAFPPRPKLLYNPTESAPIGWYKIDKNKRVKVGDRVAAYPPDWARKLGYERRYLPYRYPLIKSVWATQGMEICYENGFVSAPNFPVLPVLEQDSLGRDMPEITGCYTLGKDEIFLASDEMDASWDSRYFGPVTTDRVIGKVHYLGKGPFTLKGVP